MKSSQNNLGELRDSFRLPDGSSIYSAECIAIIKALILIKNCCDEREFVIYSDSLSCLLAIQNLQVRNRLICEAINILHSLATEYDRIVHICWVPGHVGIGGNEAADKAAKTALSGEAVDIRIPHTDFRQVISNYINDKWQSMWAEAQVDHQNDLYRAHPFLPYRYNASGLTRKEERVIARLQ